MLEITVTARRRPIELARCLRAIDTASVKALGEATIPHVSIDESDDEDETRACIAVVREMIPSNRIAVNRPKLGLWPYKNNAYATYDWVFAGGAQAVLAVEDDCLLSPDALQLCYWFLALPNCSDYLFLNLANCNRPEQTAGRELVCVESTRIESPWAWCFTRAAWERRIEPGWQCKQLPPRGWDWSLSYRMAVMGWKSLTPVLPRARNIGRSLGENGGALLFDETLAQAAWSDGTWGDEYVLEQSAEPLAYETAWMKAEAEKDGVIL